MKIFNNNKPAIVNFALLAGLTLINGSVLADELCGTGEIHCFDKETKKRVGTIKSAFSCHTELRRFNYARAKGPAVKGEEGVCIQEHPHLTPLFAKCFLEVDACKGVPLKCIAVPVCTGPLAKF